MWQIPLTLLLALGLLASSCSDLDHNAGAILDSSALAQRRIHETEFENAFGADRGEKISFDGGKYLSAEFSFAKKRPGTSTIQKEADGIAYAYQYDLFNYGETVVILPSFWAICFMASKRYLGLWK